MLTYVAKPRRKCFLLARKLQFKKKVAGFWLENFVFTPTQHKNTPTKLKH